ncbi:MAG TPA: Hsp20/alpha crystallin family protein [Kofleriaceae bacterium]|nr:Hsp20/alpha crystallin family protein [Kofleriaceae bacterium]
MLVRRNANIDYTDPFALARDLLGWSPLTGERAAVPAYSARFDVKEREDAYVLTADLPGLKEGDVDISLDNGVLTVSGARIGEEKKEGETWYLYERQHGSFSRSFRLPTEINQEKIEAQLEHGVLTLTLPKRPEAQPRKIKVRS